jgi:hypothetical protein
MSSSKQSTAATGPEQDHRWVRKAVLDGFLHRSLATAVRRVSFWAAVVLPFLHLPLLLSGIDTSVEVVVFISLLVVNALALVVGHSSDP